MIKVVSTICGWHEDSVSDAVDDLQEGGFSVTKIDRAQKMIFGVFGHDVTHIFYEEIQTGKA